MKILIVGGGIGGLTLCSFLRKKGFQVTLIEKTRKWNTIGYIIGLFPNGVKIIKKLGAYKELRKIGQALPGYEVRDENGERLLGISFNEMRKKHGPLIEIERDGLHKILRNRNKGADIRLGLTVRSLKERKNKVRVTFSDNKKEEFDLVVGADGIDSRTRDYVLKKQVAEKPKRYTGFTFWILWSPRVFNFPKNVVHYFGDGKFLGMFPSKKKLGILFMLATKQGSLKNQDPREFLKRRFSDIKGGVPNLIKNLPESKEIFHHDDDETRAKSWYRGRVVLLGDSAHALSPVLGMGASMALEDAYVLSEELSKNKDVQGALENYFIQRKQRVDKLASWSKQVHSLMAVKKPFDKPRNLFIKHIYSKIYYRNIDKFLEDGPE